jgi:hypothetical protein
MLDLSSPQILIHLEENPVIAGRLAHGSVFITSDTVFSDVSIDLSLSGLEELRIYNNFQLTSGQKSKIISFSTPIKKSETLEAGSYKIPFSFIIPSSAPASFSYSDETSANWYIKGSISYLLTCFFTSKTSESSGFLQVFLRSSRSLMPCFEEVERKEVIPSCFCSAAGFSVFCFEGLEKEYCQVNGRMVYKLLVNNSNARRAIVRVCSQVVRVILFKGEKEDVKLRHVINKIYRQVNVPKKTGFLDSPDFLFIHDLKMGYEDYNTSSTMGNIISCKFYLEIIVYYRRTWAQPLTMLLELFVNPRERVAEQVNYPSGCDEDMMVFLNE